MLLRALKRLRSGFDAVMCDGQGVAHPRRFGLASHLGVIVGKPTLGCAKSKLCGEHGAVGADRGSTTELSHRAVECARRLRINCSIALDHR